MHPWVVVCHPFLLRCRYDTYMDEMRLVVGGAMQHYTRRDSKAKAGEGGS